MIYYFVGIADRPSNIMIECKHAREMHWVLVRSVAPVLNSFDILINARCLCLSEITSLNWEHKGFLIGFLFLSTSDTWHLAPGSVWVSRNISGVSKPAAEEAEAPRRLSLPSSWAPSLLHIYLGCRSFALRYRTTWSTGDTLYSALTHLHSPALSTLFPGAGWWKLHFWWFPHSCYRKLALWS